MSRILIWRPVTKGNELDIFNKTEYASIYEHIQNNFGGDCPNWGNKLWFMGLYSQIDDGKNEITFRSSETIDEINERYDMIIYPMANFFGVEWAGGMEALAQTFNQIKIPTYIIACGVQAKTYAELDLLVSQIGERAKKFIAAIYNTGGDIALRGEFSKEFFVKLGFPQAVVTGCPSIYQLGRNFQMQTAEKVEKDKLVPVFNGKTQLYKKAVEYYDKGVYFDQDHYFHFLYNKHILDERSLRRDMRFYRTYCIESALLLSEGRLKQIADMDEWHAYLKQGEFNYSFGSRIHGSIMPILSQIPATVLAIDTRTREMAEFYNIPFIDVTEKTSFTADDVYKAYLDADYTKFNAGYAEKFARYENFLKERGIAEKINDENKFLNNAEYIGDFEKYTQNTDAFKTYYKQLKSKKALLAFGDLLLKMKEKLR